VPNVLFLDHKCIPTYKCERKGQCFPTLEVEALTTEDRITLEMARLGQKQVPTANLHNKTNKCMYAECVYHV
jgi:hypothetical protein